jgi:hypothetical protein
MDVAAFTESDGHMSATLLSMIGLGGLVDFIIRDALGQRLRVTPTGERWLGW